MSSKGQCPIHYVCSMCGAENLIHEYVEFFDCYACGYRKNFDEKFKAELREQFPEGVIYKHEENVYEKQIFQGLNLSKEDTKYISIQDDDTVRFVFPIKIESIKAGDKKLILDREAEEGTSKAIAQFFATELYEGGFQYNGSSGMEHDFYKEFNTDEEAKEAGKWLVAFKKRFGI